MADIYLCNIMGELAASVSKKPALNHDQPRITSLLTRWMSSLPEELRLYNEDGSKLEYHFALYELYIEYLGTVILSATLTRQNQRQSLCSVLCIVAALCMADFYEEILCREHGSFLGSIHGFWCIVAALPLLYCVPERSANESRRKESLEILCSVLNLMRCKFGVAETAAQKVSDLTEERQNMLQEQLVESTHTRSTQSGIWADEQQVSDLQALFINVHHWCPDFDEILSDPGIDRIARADVDTLENLSHWSVEGLYSMCDVSGASTFTDPLFANVYLHENFGATLM